MSPLEHVLKPHLSKYSTIMYFSKTCNHCSYYYPTHMYPVIGYVLGILRPQALNPKPPHIPIYTPMYIYIYIYSCTSLSRDPIIGYLDCQDKPEATQPSLLVSGFGLGFRVCLKPFERDPIYPCVAREGAINPKFLTLNSRPYRLYTLNPKIQSWRSFYLYSAG